MLLLGVRMLLCVRASLESPTSEDWEDFNPLHVSTISRINPGSIQRYPWHISVCPPPPLKVLLLTTPLAVITFLLLPPLFDPPDALDRVKSRGILSPSGQFNSLFSGCSSKSTSSIISTPPFHISNIFVHSSAWKRNDRISSSGKNEEGFCRPKPSR